VPATLLAFMQTSSKTFFALTLSLALLGSGCEPPAPKHNVLLVTLDTTRADYLGCYGFDEATPAIDTLASRGTRFDLAISSASVTPVSHATILTGRSNRAHGLRVFAGPGGFVLPEGVPTLAEILRGEGYATGAIHSAFPVSSYFQLDRGFEHFDDFDATIAATPDGVKRWSMKDFQRRSDETTDRVLTYLAETADPFFLWVHYWDPHDADLLPPDYALEYDENDRFRKGLYAEEVRYVDEQLGRVVAQLDASGRSDSTIIAIVADHGQGLGDHGWVGHRILYQEQVRVPLVFVVPGIEQELVVEELVRSMDIAPTIFDILGLDAPAGTTGASLRKLMTGKPEAPRLAFADQINGFDENASMVRKRPFDSFLYVAMDQRWKLTYRPTFLEGNELYDLESDPKELDNLFDKHPDIVLRLMKELAFEDPWVTEAFERIDVEGRDVADGAMNDLGYSGEDEPEEDEEEPSTEAHFLGSWTDWVWLCPDPEHEASNPGAVRGDLCKLCATPMIPRVPEAE